MREAGLPMAFYAHFASREAMAVADRAGAVSVGMLDQLVSTVPPQEAYRTLVKTYLSRAHVESAETGCPVAALGSEMPRQVPEVCGKPRPGASRT